MRKTLFILSAVLLADVIVQLYLAAFGYFHAPASIEDFSLHAFNGQVVLRILGLLVVIAAFAARAPRNLKWLAAAPLLLSFVQIVLFILSSVDGSSFERTYLLGSIILGLHGLNGLLIIYFSYRLLLRTRTFVRAPQPSAESAVAPAR